MSLWKPAECPVISDSLLALRMSPWLGALPLTQLCTKPVIGQSFQDCKPSSTGMVSCAATVGSRSPPCVVQGCPASVSYQVAPSPVHSPKPVPSFQGRVIRCASRTVDATGPHSSHSEAVALETVAVVGMPLRSKRSAARITPQPSLPAPTLTSMPKFAHSTELAS